MDIKIIKPIHNIVYHLKTLCVRLVCSLKLCEQFKHVSLFNVQLQNSSQVYTVQYFLVGLTMNEMLNITSKVFENACKISLLLATSFHKKSENVVISSCDIKDFNAI